MSIGLAAGIRPETAYAYLPLQGCFIKEGLSDGQVSQLEHILRKGGAGHVVTKRVGWLRKGLMVYTDSARVSDVREALKTVVTRGGQPTA